MPLTTDDIVAIQQVIARYAHALDTGDEAGLVSVFTEDAICWTGPEGTSRQGMQAIREMARNTVVGRLWHYITNVVVEGDGDEALVKAYLLMYRELGREPIVGWYEFEMKRVDGRWLIAYRRVDGRPRLRREGREAS